MYHTILVPLDGSALSEAALPTASLLARKSGALLVLVRAIQPSARPEPTSDESHDHYIEDDGAYLETIARHLAQQGLAVEVGMPHTPAAKGILNEIKRRHADLVVMTTHGRSGVGRWLYGSVAEAILKQCPVPIWLIHAGGPAHLSILENKQPRLLVPLDGSPSSEAALPHATTLAHLLNGALLLLHVLTPPRLLPQSLVGQPRLNLLTPQNECDGRQYLARLAAQVTVQGVAVETIVRTGEAAEAILAETVLSQIGLIVMTSHGRSGVERLLFGSVASEVLRRSATPLVVIRPSTSLSLPTPELTTVMLI